jgi:hypothetical protein
MSDETTVEAQAAEQAPQAEQSPELTVNDLNAIKQIIDVASSRGAFKPNEMMVVGQTYNKLEMFLSAVTQQGQTEGEK